MQKMVSVKSDALRYAREYYNVSLEEVCSKTKIKIDVLEKYEKGDDFPSYAQLEKLASYYNRPVFFFFSNYRPETSKVQVAFRSIQNSNHVTLPKQTRELIEKADLYRLNLLELYKDDDKSTFSDLLKENCCSKQEDLMALLRDKLELSLEKQVSFPNANKLLEYAREKLYDIGIYVFKDSFRDNSISGLCIYDDSFPIVLLNNKATFNRQLFTLFHEIYHIYTKEADVDFVARNEESACNTFASEFLIPEKDLLNEIEMVDELVNKSVIDDLAKRYNVSADAIMYRLVKMGKLDGSFYNQNRISDFRQSKSSSGNFYNTKISYLGNSYLNKIFSSYYAGNISKAQVGIYTSLRSANVSKLASKMFGGGF